jgi:hypothetical protein
VKKGRRLVGLWRCDWLARLLAEFCRARDFRLSLRTSFGANHSFSPLPSRRHSAFRLYYDRTCKIFSASTHLPSATSLHSPPLRSHLPSPSSVPTRPKTLPAQHPPARTARPSQHNGSYLICFGGGRKQRQRSTGRLGRRLVSAAAPIPVPRMHLAMHVSSSFPRIRCHTLHSTRITY